VSDLTDAQRLARAEHARRAMEEFLAPAFEQARAAYAARMVEIAATTPWESGKITALANAVRIVDEVEAQIGAQVADGADARGKMIRADRIEALTPAKRRLLNIGAF
jgi:maltoporin